MAIIADTIGVRGSGPGEFVYPMGIAADKNGNIYVVDSGNARIQRFKAPYLNEHGELIDNDVDLVFDGSDNITSGKLIRPLKIAVSSETTESNTIYVIDHGRNAVIEFTTSGAFYSSITSPPFSSPVDIAVTYGDLLTVFVAEADAYSPQIKKINTYGTVTGYITLDKLPSAIAVDRTNTYIYVAFKDQTIGKYVIASGNRILVFGSEGLANGQLNNVSGMFVDKDNNLYVVDTNNYRVQKFDSNGNYLEKFGSFGSAAGQFNEPNAVTVIKDPTTPNKYFIYAIDKLNYRMQRYIADNPPAPVASVKPDNWTDAEWEASSQTITALRNPFNSTFPTLRWRFNDEDLSSGDYQTACQVQISKVVDFSTIIFDSGVVENVSGEGGIATYTVTQDLVDEGRYYYKVKVRDSYGLWSPYAIGSFDIDITGPINPYIKINEAPQTNLSTVTLTLSVDGDAYEMLISDKSDFAGAIWQSYRTAGTYTFTDIVPNTEVQKTLYCKFRDKAWNETNVVTDNVTIDTNKPQNVSVTLDVPAVAQYFDVDHVVTKTEEFVAFNGVNNFRGTEVYRREDIIHTPVNSHLVNNPSAGAVYYLLNNDLRKMDGNLVDHEGLQGTLDDFNNGRVDFYIEGITGIAVTFFANSSDGTLVFSRAFTHDEITNGVFVSYRTGQKHFKLSRSFARRNPELLDPTLTDEQKYYALGLDPVIDPVLGYYKDIVVYGVDSTGQAYVDISSTLKIVGLDVGEPALYNQPERLAEIVFNNSPKIEQLGNRSVLTAIGVQSTSVIEVEDTFGFFVGKGLKIGSDDKLYLVISIDVDNRKLYLDSTLPVAYPVGTSVNTLAQLKVVYYYGSKEFAVSSTSVIYSLHADGATQVFIDGDVVSEVGRTKEWIPYSPSKVVTLLPLSGDEVLYPWKKFGRRNVYFNFKDGAGNETGNVTIPGGTWLDLRLPIFPDAPELPVYIQEGSQTNTQVIHLIFNLPYPHGIQVLVQGDVVQESGVTFEWIDYPLDNLLKVLLTDTNGLKSIDVYFRTQSLNTRGPVLLTITLDTSVPIGTGKYYYWRVALFT